MAISDGNFQPESCQIDIASMGRPRALLEGGGQMPFHDPLFTAKE
ncbi:MAG: hypothetical protein Q7S69_08425 [Nitrosomonadaceae bacterium]|nr:hypothetical protein [Nitrosomonadaceae bacterium]